MLHDFRYKLNLFIVFRQKFFDQIGLTNVVGIYNFGFRVV